MKLLRRIVLYIAAIVLIIGFIILFIYIKGVLDYKQSVKEITLDDINISDVADGVYVGECDVNFIYVKVKVTVQGGKISSINILEHKNGHGKPAEAVINEIIDEQMIDVDAITGATNSSTVIKKAVENAITKGL